MQDSLDHLWHPLLLPLLSLSGSKVIVEIGCADGHNTKNLLEFCRQRGGVLHAIDPSPAFDPSDWQKSDPDSFIFRRETSLEALPTIVDAYDAVIIDGDHNWFTVTHELLEIERHAKTTGLFPLIILHDVGWPYGRRDMYSNPDLIPISDRHPYARKGLVPLCSSLQSETGLNPHVWNACEEGTKKNGVLTAVEDFLAHTSFSLEFLQLPGFFGIGILLSKDKLASCRALKKFFDELSFSVAHPEQMQRLESARLSLVLHALEDKREIDCLREEKAHLLSSFCALELEQRRLRKEANDLRDHSERLQSDIDRMQQSRSWKLTHCLRVLEPAIRSLFQRKESSDLQSFIPPKIHRPPITSLHCIPTPVSHDPKHRMIATIVIPAYGNLSALSACIQSCIDCIDHRHTILIVDDCSPDTGYEAAVREMITGLPNVRYERNERNFGFVQTCNRAVSSLADSVSDILLLNSDTVVTEGFLEEMLACLHDCDRNAVCCPRSNDATLLTIPLRHSGSIDDFRAMSYRCWKNLKNSLPRTTPIPTGVGFCMLIRRTILDRFGLFDEAYGRGYNEENDFCMRINRYGYSVVAANRAYVFHDGGGSFTGHERALLEAKNGQLLRQRYPEYEGRIRSHFSVGLPACEHFSDILGGCYQRKKILLDLSHLVAAHNGTAEYALSLCKELHPLLSQEFDVTLLTHPTVDRYFKLSLQYPRVLHVDRLPDERFDLVFVPQQVFSPRHLEQLNRLAVKWVINMQDIIALRCGYLRNDDLEFALRFSAQHADGILSVSHSSLADLQSFIGSEACRKDGLAAAVLHAYPEAIEERDDAGIPEGDFLFLVGNAFEHKAVSEALLYVPLGMQVTVLGGDDHPVAAGKCVRFLRSGSVPDALIDALYRKARVVLFPSQYEGFGLPLLHAAGNGTPVIACDTAAVREVVESFDLDRIVHRFKTFQEIPALIDRAMSSPRTMPKEKRSWHDAAEETARFLRSVLQLPTDFRALEERMMLLRALERTRHTAAPSKYLSLLAFLGKVQRRIRRFFTQASY